MSDTAEPVSYEGVPEGVPMLSSTGTQFGTLEKVLEVPSEDLFDGVIVKTQYGRRFVDRDQIAEITTEYIRCDLDDDAAANCRSRQATRPTTRTPTTPRAAASARGCTGPSATAAGRPTASRSGFQAYQRGTRLVISTACW